MNKNYESKYHLLEENYWWFKSRRQIIYQLIQELNIKKDAKILEIGCSGGALIRFLNKKGFNETYGIDISEDAIKICKKRKIQNVNTMDARNIKFTNNKFDLIIASDIIEHIKEDKSALLEWNRILNVNGKMIIFAPAFNYLWSNHDTINRHYRRYNKKSFLKILNETNFQVNRISYWNFTIFFPILGLQILQKNLRLNFQKKDRLYKINPIINKLLILLLKIEKKYLHYLNFPIGVSIFAVCKKNIKNE
jgi:ubiquinone/menaquinone biosynthesis C-methylase UbiE